MGKPDLSLPQRLVPVQAFREILDKRAGGPGPQIIEGAGLNDSSRLRHSRATSVRIAR